MIGIVTVNVAGLQDAKGLNNGDNQVQAQAVVDDLNAHGGIAGRRIVPVYATFEATSRNWEADYQAICTSLTEDHKVFAVVNATTAYARTFVPCLAQHNTPLVNSAGGQADDLGMRQLAPYFFNPGSANLTRIARFYVDGLAAEGFFSAGTKVGLVRVDDNAFKRASDNMLKPRLAAIGVTVAQEAVVSAQTSLADTASQMPALTLRFHQSGINRVLFLDNATIAPLFAIQASSQGYNPRYGLTTLSNPVLIEQNVPASSLQGAIGVGWQPAQDVLAQYEPPSNAPTARCDALMAKAGQGGVSRTGQWAERMYCDELSFLKTTLDRAQEVTPAGLMAQVEALGTSFVSTMTFHTQFGPGRHDGSAAVRLLAFDDGCKCFKYTGGERTVD
ncbi:MAG: ABC transporter substrate-binding protein [Acidimicrobiales bacterium]